MPRWLVWTLLAVVCWGIWALLGKLIGDTLSPALTQALSTIGLLPVMAILITLWPGRNRLSGPSNPNRVTYANRGSLLAFTAGIITCLGNIAYYTVLSKGTKASTVVPLTALYPVVTIVLAMLILKERLSGFQIAGIVLSLTAIYLFNVQGEQGFFSAWLAVALIPIALWGIGGLLQKIATNSVSGEISTWWFLAAFVPVAICILIKEPVPAGIAAKTWLLVSALGLTFALGNYALLVAFASNGKASVITPLGGLYPLVSIPIAILFLGERIGWRETIGIILALVSAVALAQESRIAAPENDRTKKEIAS